MSEDSKDIPVSQPEGHLAEPPAAATPDTPSLRGRRPRFRRDGAGTTTERAATTDALTPADTVDEQEGDAEDTPIPATRAAVDVPADDGPNELDSAETTVQPARRALRQVKVVMQAMLGTTESSRRHPPLEALGSMIVLVALLVVVGLVSEALPQAPQTVMPGADVRLVCPGFADYPGVITGQMQGEARYGVIGSPGSDRTLSTQVSIPEVSAPSTLEAAQGASQLVARRTIA
ncbi:MAG: hypothetical protein LBH11_02485, partial [Propionibacteriaceae bacterium]|nr:hypothetical protein [Propionibacteriaceae bacterium]